MKENHKLLEMQLVEKNEEINELNTKLLQNIDTNNDLHVLYSYILEFDILIS